jgi:hypothetical protein
LDYDFSSDGSEKTSFFLRHIDHLIGIENAQQKPRRAAQAKVEVMIFNPYFPNGKYEFYLRKGVLSGAWVKPFRFAACADTPCARIVRGPLTRARLTRSGGRVVECAGFEIRFRSPT